MLQNRDQFTLIYEIHKRQLYSEIHERRDSTSNILEVLTATNYVICHSTKSRTLNQTHTKRCLTNDVCSVGYNTFRDFSINSSNTHRAYLL